MKKQKTLNQKIRLPYLMMIVIMPLLVFIVFNFALRSYFYRNTLNDLKQSFTTVQVLVREEVATRLPQTTTQPTLEQVRSTLTSLNHAIRLAKRTQNTEILFTNSNEKLIFPKDFSETDLSEDLIADLVSKAGPQSLNVTQKIDYDGRTYLVAYSELKVLSSRASQNYLILVAPLIQNDSMLRQINLILIGIILVAVAIGSLVANKVSGDITKPIRAAALHATEISKGKYDLISSDPKSKEMSVLYNSLNDMSSVIQQSEQARIYYFQNLSHDLRTPLMSIQGYAEGISSGVFEDTAQAAAIIASESIRLKLLVDQLLTLSRLESGAQKLHLEKVDIKELLDQYAQRVQGITKQQNKMVTLNCPDDCYLLLDEELFEKAITNLLSNAVKYAQKIIVIDVTNRDTSVVIQIQDDGPGLNPETIPHLFDRFYKGDQGNFGLGLAIVATAVQLLGGRVTAENHKKGALFTVTLNRT
ncbi:MULTISPECIES: cell wall metabolism sensor histidine kinase WalK [unclassified Fusibacter]|uniref:sensor histidine kinase n=1 Tax=unclassified Fusibacter TaxID=2624464 RepID=UPI00101122D2|nr:MULTISPECIES: HAMP domain-containing sensor histidine kinase [unclassified Fusibacter]MCK8060381.1 HAMP domain-containing histidine kinase [Fusibacter sp. A2]NPE20330.1 HAMP domain-containing histidine kinase [Fusibacter sp. A1]RXV63536.1 sensor histidine kinase [Fusibacter sp. A1]